MCAASAHTPSVNGIGRGGDALQGVACPDSQAQHSAAPQTAGLATTLVDAGKGWARHTLRPRVCPPCWSKGVASPVLCQTVNLLQLPMLFFVIHTQPEWRLRSPLLTGNHCHDI